MTWPFAMGDRPPMNPQKPIEVYKDWQVDRLVESARVTSLRWWAFLATIAHTGRRVGEVLGLEWAWLDLDCETPHFNLPHTKNKRQQYVPLDSYLRERVFIPENVAALQTDAGRLARDPAVYVFPWHYSTVQRKLRAHCDKLGIEDKGFHRFRHTKVTEMLVRGVPIQAVSSLIGHARVSTTDSMYNHADALNYAKYLD